MILLPIVQHFPEYLDAVNNLGVCDMFLNNVVQAFVSIDVKVFRRDKVFPSCDCKGLQDCRCRQQLRRSPCHSETVSVVQQPLNPRSFSYAVELLERVVDTDSTKSHVWNNLSIAYLGAGNVQKAWVALKNSLALDPDQKILRCNMATMLSITVASEKDAATKKVTFEKAEDLFGHIMKEAASSSVQAGCGLCAVNTCSRRL